MPRFVLLRHDHPTLHWDFMLEMGDVLRTWRLSAEPGDTPVAAERSFDHRLHYLDYEGPVSGGRGFVVREDWGDYQVVAETEELLRVHLAGGKLRGSCLIQRHTEEEWLLTLQPD